MFLEGRFHATISIVHSRTKNRGKFIRQVELTITAVLYFETGVAMVPTKKNCHENTYSCNVYDFWTKRMSHLILVSLNFWKHLEEVYIMVKAVHRSNQPAFGPNPQSTRLGRVTEKRTRNQLKYGLNPPGRIIGLNGLDLLLGLFCKFYWI